MSSLPEISTNLWEFRDIISLFGKSADSSALAKAGCQPRKHAILPAILPAQPPPS
jgi:hypothetical protein